MVQFWLMMKLKHDQSSVQVYDYESFIIVC